MRKLCAVLVLAGVCASVTNAEATCYQQFGRAFEGPSQDTEWIDFSGSTSSFNSPPPSYDYWYVCSSVTYNEARVWIEGRQPSQYPVTYSGCSAHTGSIGAAEAAYGVCSSFHNGPSFDSVRMSYKHPSIVTGCWGGTVQHFRTLSSWETRYLSRCYSISPPMQCSLIGQPYYWNGSDCVDGGGSPILLPMRGERLDFSQYKLTDALRGVRFDIDGDGVKEQMAWTDAGSNLAFLAIDRNGNGVIDNGTELFGNHTAPGAREGFTALYQIMAQANDGRENAIDAADPLYERLLLWEDRNHDGISQKSELARFGDVYASIGTGASVEPEDDAFGNRGLYRGWAEKRTRQDRLDRAQSGKEHADRIVNVWDVFFKVQ